MKCFYNRSIFGGWGLGGGFCQRSHTWMLKAFTIIFDIMKKKYGGVTINNKYI